MPPIPKNYAPDLRTKNSKLEHQALKTAAKQASDLRIPVSSLSTTNTTSFRRGKPGKSGNLSMIAQVKVDRFLTTNGIVKKTCVIFYSPPIP